MTNKRKNIIFIAAVLAAAAVLWLVCRTGGSGHTAVLLGISFSVMSLRENIMK